MRKIVAMVMMLLGWVTASGQNDKEAEAILERAAAAYEKTSCLSIRFSGSQTGEMILQGECFYMDIAGVKSWYDGKTQWSYVERNEEVNISTPSQEEIDTVHPYGWISRYKTDFSCKYTGKKTVNGKEVDEVVLIPKQSQELKKIRLCLASDSEPISIGITQSDGEEQRLNITSCETKRKQDITVFRFDKSKYPNAEEIDLRN